MRMEVEKSLLIVQTMEASTAIDFVRGSSRRLCYLFDNVQIPTTSKNVLAFKRFQYKKIYEHGGINLTIKCTCASKYVMKILSM